MFSKDCIRVNYFFADASLERNSLVRLSYFFTIYINLSAKVQFLANRLAFAIWLDDVPTIITTLA